MVERGHRRAELRSLARHREVASRLRADPELRVRARDWLVHSDVHPWYLERWLALLDGPLDALCELLERDDEEARDLRQCTPFRSGGAWRRCPSTSA